jgi:hypothetical protein
LRPFGAQDVLAASLDDVPRPPWSGTGLDRGSVVSFLAEQATWRPGVLAALLDAVAAAMADPREPMVVLAVAEQRRSLLWIAAVSHLMSPGTSRALRWSSYERGSGVGKRGDRGVRLAVVPIEDVDAAGEADGVVVVADDRESVELGDLHGVPHRTGSGAQIAVTPWSVMAPVVLQDPVLAERVLQLQDEIAAEQGDRGLPCGWALAAAARELAEELPDAQAEAQLLLEDPRSPRVRARRPAAPASVPAAAPRGAAAPLPVPPPAEPRVDTAAEAWGVVEQFADDGQVTSHLGARATEVYLRLAMHDRHWLTRPGGVPRPDIDSEWFEPEAVNACRAELDALAEEGSRPEDDPLPTAVAAVRLIDLAVSVGLAEFARRCGLPLDQEVEAVLDRVVGPVLLDGRRAPALVATVGPVSGPTVQVVRAWVDRRLDGAGGRPGDRVAREVVGWLHPAMPRIPSIEELDSAGGSVPASLAELAVQATAVPHPPGMRRLALWAVLGGPDDEPTRAAVQHLADGPALSAREATALVRRHGPQSLVPVLRRVLWLAPNDEELRALLRELRNGSLGPYLSDPDVRGLLHVADLRHLAATWYGAEVAMKDPVSPLLQLAESVLVPAPELPHPGVVRRVVAAYIAEIVSHRDDVPDRSVLAEWIRVRAAPGGNVSLVVAEVLYLAVARGVMSAAALAAAALLSAPQQKPDVVRHAPPRLVELGGLRIGHAPSEPLLERVVRTWLRSPHVDEDRVLGVVARAQQEMQARLRIDLAPRDQDRLRVYAGEWWQWVGSPGLARALFPHTGAP